MHLNNGDDRADAILRSIHGGLSVMKAKRDSPRILVVSPYIEGVLKRGGPAKSVWAMCRGLRAAGAEVTVFTTSAEPVADRSRLKTMGKEPKVIAVPLPRWSLPTFEYYRVTSGVIPALRSLISAAEIVLIQGIFNFPAIVACHLSRKMSIPFVVTPRGQLQLRSLKQKRLKKAIFHQFVIRRALECSAAIHFTSELEAERSLPVVRGRRTFVVGNGFEFDAQDEPCHTGRSLPASDSPAGVGSRTRMPRAVRPDDRHACELGIVGFVDARRGFDILIPALARSPGDIHLQVIGSGPARQTARVRRLIGEYELGGRVQLRGFLQGEALADAYRSLDYLVVPSKSESFGNTVIEALGLGVPVIVNPNVPLATLVREQGLGMVVENTVEAWTAALATVVAAPRRWDPQRLSRVVRDRFDYRTIGVKLRGSLMSVLEER